MIQAYKITIVYFFLLGFLLLLSGVILFNHKIGFTFQNIITYYNGDPDQFILQKSTIGKLKIVLPHIFSFALFIMVLTHFLRFCKCTKNTYVTMLIVFLYTFAFIEIASPFFIQFFPWIFALFKISSFILLNVLILLVIWLLLQCILKN